MRAGTPVEAGLAALFHENWSRAMCDSRAQLCFSHPGGAWHAVLVAASGAGPD